MKKMQRQLENYFGNYKENTLFIKADVSDEKAVIDMYKNIEEKFGRLDGLVNNAI